MTTPPLVRSISSVPEQIAGDGCFLRELLHPDRDGSAIRYSLAYAFVEPGGRTLDHVLEQSEVYYGLAGAATLFLDGSPYPIEPGSCICIPPRCRQHLENHGETRFEFLCIVDPPWTGQGEKVLPPLI